MRIADSKVPPAGAWARCPQCRERFFVNPAALSLENLSEPESFSPNPGGDQASREVLARLKKRLGVAGEAPPLEPGLATVYPRAAASENLRLAVSCFLLALPLLAMACIFQTVSAASRAQAPPQAVPLAAVARLNDNSNRELIREDLMGIRRYLVNRQGRAVSQKIDYSGPEVRVFKYFLSNLLPEVCSGIHYLELEPSPSSSGFSAFGHCLEADERIVEMRVEWQGSRALISFPLFRQASAEFEMFPPPLDRSSTLPPLPPETPQ